MFPHGARHGRAGELRAAGITCDLRPSATWEGLFVTLHGNEQIDRYIAPVRQALRPATGTRSSVRFAYLDDGVRS